MSLSFPKNNFKSIRLKKEKHANGLIFVPENRSSNQFLSSPMLTNYMATLTNKDKRIKKLENDLKQAEDTINTLKKRIFDLEKKRKNYLK